jgi:hypothetical protein
MRSGTYLGFSAKTVPSSCQFCSAGTAKYSTAGLARGTAVRARYTGPQTQSRAPTVTHLRSLAARASPAAGRTSGPSPAPARGSPPRSAPAQSPCNRHATISAPAASDQAPQGVCATHRKSVMTGRPGTTSPNCAMPGTFIFLSLLLSTPSRWIERRFHRHYTRVLA